MHALGNLLDIAVSVEELHRWPLIHGYMDLPKNVAAIAREGLLASGGRAQGLNSYDLDVAAGRNDYVFLAPARISGGYGLGQFLFVDPSIIEDNAGIYGFLHDPHYLFTQLRVAIVFFLAGTANEELAIDKDLRNVIRVAADDLTRDIGRNDSFSDDELIEAIGKRQLLKQYIARNSLTPNELFHSLAQKAQQMNMDMRAFLRRDNLWDEELLVPKTVEPRYILGFIIKGKWHALYTAANPETAVRLEVLLQEMGVTK